MLRRNTSENSLADKSAQARASVSARKSSSSSSSAVVVVRRRRRRSPSSSIVTVRRRRWPLSSPSPSIVAVVIGCVGLFFSRVSQTGPSAPRLIVQKAWLAKRSGKKRRTASMDNGAAERPAPRLITLRISLAVFWLPFMRRALSISTGERCGAIVVIGVGEGKHEIRESARCLSTSCK